MSASAKLEHADAWPSLSLEEWRPTYETLHRWMQVVGKTRLALAPFQNHWWNCALYVSTRGVTTSPMPYAGFNVEVEFDFLDDVLVARTSDGHVRSMRLSNKSVAEFYHEYRSIFAELEIEFDIHPAPNEMADATPFAEDHEHETYDGDAVRRWWRVLTLADQALQRFRSGFVGKCSPSHLWWGGLDLACTRFSGRRAPPWSGTIPNCPRWVMLEAYSHECISAGWWPGTPGSPISEPAFYAYAYPEPAGCPTAPIMPLAAGYSPEMHEWILPYEAVRASNDPSTMIAEFLESTYLAAARLGGWDVDGLRAKDVAP